MIRVVVSGAAGRMGRESCKAVYQAADMALVGAVDANLVGNDIGKIIGMEEFGVPVKSDLKAVLELTEPDVMVDFTKAEVALNNVKLAINQRIRPVVGTTGLSTMDIDGLTKLAAEKQVGALIAPNFALGALLMIKFATEAAKYFPHVEIIELHHDQKIDAPSGTAVKTAEAIATVRESMRQGLPTEYEKLPGARGGEFEGMRLHSVRLPGLVAHQEVLFGSLGQTLSIRHDSISRESFMPGLLIGIRKIIHLQNLVYGLEKLIFD